jgi:16S rRNA (cytidine1402-2'-O)-methyltransferase
MSLVLVPTPIGHKDDFTIRGIEKLRDADVIIVEEFKESSTWLRSQGISGKTLESLNEHSTAEDLQRLVGLCAAKNVALITDCGTPGFADPGADLVKLCRQKKIAVQALPGASSLMTLLSLSSERLNQFVFRGFLSNENDLRQKQWKELVNETRAIVLMDTPYRFNKTVQELATYLPQRRILLALNLTQDDEVIFEGKAADIAAKVPNQKAEFMLLIYAS